VDSWLEVKVYVKAPHDVPEGDAVKDILKAVYSMPNGYLLDGLAVVRRDPAPVPPRSCRVTGMFCWGGQPGHEECK
jgi:hypothetical protein